MPFTQHIPHARRQQIRLVGVVVEKFAHRASPLLQYKRRVKPSSHTDSSAPLSLAKLVLWADFRVGPFSGNFIPSRGITVSGGCCSICCIPGCEPPRNPMPKLTSNSCSPSRTGTPPPSTNFSRAITSLSSLFSVAVQLTFRGLKNSHRKLS